MAIDPVCGVEVNPDTALSIAYQGRTYYFHSHECRNRFFSMICSGEVSNSEKQISSEDVDSLNFGEFPDPNDLKTHGDIGGWTDKKYF